MIGKNVLLLLGQSPFDPTSGAAQSTRLIAELLAQAGFSVNALATTACEGPIDSDAALREAVGPEADALAFVRNGVSYQLIRVDPAWKHSWERRVGADYERAFQAALRQGRPDIVLTYGGDPTDEARRRAARASGAKVVFALHNLAYQAKPPREVDAFLAPTQYLANEYASRLDAPLVVLPPPLDPARVLAAAFDPKLIVFVNPEPAKGAILVAQLARRLGLERPEQPLLVVGGRAPAEALLRVGRDLGFDLGRFPNILALPPTPDVAAIWGETRLLLMPSVVREAAGRCALEAMLNGAVPLVSDQAGLAEIAGDAGIRLPPPPETRKRAQPVPPRVVDAWWAAIVRLLDDPAEWARVSAACRVRAGAFRPEALAPRYAEVFSGLLAGLRP